jgi:hypothetical protein
MTVKTVPSESTTMFLRATLLALVYPFSGIFRGIRAIVGYSIFCDDDLQIAARSGALCIAVRNLDWVPENDLLVPGVIVGPGKPFTHAVSDLIPKRNEDSPVISTHNLMAHSQGSLGRHESKPSRSDEKIESFDATSHKPPVVYDPCFKRTEACSSDREIQETTIR